MVPAAKGISMSVFARIVAPIKLTKYWKYSHGMGGSPEPWPPTIGTHGHAASTFRPKNPTRSGVCVRANDVVARVSTHKLSIFIGNTYQ